MHTYAATDVGRRRDHNEDAVLTTALAENTQLLAVADGMGGHNAGEIASEAALDSVQSFVESTWTPEEDDGSLLRTAAQNANSSLTERAAADPELDGMGTTLVAAILSESSATIVNVGDSRAYHVTGRTIEQLTVDHSLVQELINSGDLSPSAATDHPQRNVITQSLGPSGSIDPDVYTAELTGTLLLCSDGLTEELPDSEIRHLVQGATDIEQAARDLVEAANQNGGEDNISVVLAVE